MVGLVLTLKRQSIINFMVYCDNCTMFLQSIKADQCHQGAKYIHILMVDMISEVRKKNSIQIMIHNNTNFKKVRKDMWSLKFNIF